LLWTYVKGHQDWKLITALSRAAWLNIKADALVWDAIQEIKPGTIVYRIPYGSRVCYLDTMQLVKQFKSQLWAYVNSPKAIEYWKKRHQMDLQIWTNIDWDAVEAAYKKSLVGW